MIIIINGCASAGKTSIIKEMQKLCNKPLLHVGIDCFTFWTLSIQRLHQKDLRSWNL